MGYNLCGIGINSYRCVDELYCDVCEQERDPEHPVYYCAQCDHAAHVECVNPQVPPLVGRGSTLARQLGHKESDTLTNVDGEIAGGVVSKEVVVDDIEQKGAETDAPNRGDAFTERLGGALSSPTSEVGDGVISDLSLSVLDQKIDRLRVKVKAETKKLEAQRAKLGAPETKLCALMEKRSEDYDYN